MPSAIGGSLAEAVVETTVANDCCAQKLPDLMHLQVTGQINYLIVTVMKEQV